MSPLARVFVVVNLILAIAFFGTSATLFATRQNWREMAEKYKKKAEDDLAASKKRWEDVGARIVKINEDRLKAQTNLNSTVAEKVKVESKLNETEAKVKTLDTRIDNEVKEKTALTGRLQDLEKKNAELNSLVDAKTKESDEAKANMEKYKAEYTRIRIDLDRVNEQKKGSEIELATVKSKLETAELQLDWVKKNNPTLSLDGIAPPIDAIVQAVEGDKKLVVLSVGKDQKVKEGFEFTVYRGDRFVGKVKVIKVWDDLAGARILYTSENEAVQVGDKAATQI